MTIDLAVRGEYIQLDQLLKATGLCASGGAAHAAVAEGRVRVDGAVDTRKRAKLRPGQTVSFAGEEVRLVASPVVGAPDRLVSNKDEKAKEKGAKKS
jgi:ribosome-associated protein